MTDQPIVVFTDGAAKRNPGPGGWGVIIVTPDGHVTELGGGAPLTTNNKMELTGAIQALTRLSDTPGRLAIYTDSTYVIQGIEQWVHNWRRKRVEDGRRRRGDEPRAVGGAVGSDGGSSTAIDRLALRARSRRHSRQRTRRRDRRRLRRERPRRALRRPAARLPRRDARHPRRHQRAGAQHAGRGRRCRRQRQVEGARLLVSERRRRQADAPQHLGRLRTAGEGPFRARASRRRRARPTRPRSCDRGGSIPATSEPRARVEGDPHAAHYSRARPPWPSRRRRPDRGRVLRRRATSGARPGRRHARRDRSRDGALPARRAHPRHGVGRREGRPAGAREGRRRAGHRGEASGHGRHAVPHRLDDQGVHGAVDPEAARRRQAVARRAGRDLRARAARLAATRPRTRRRSASASCSRTPPASSPTTRGATGRRRCPRTTSRAC